MKLVLIGDDGKTKLDTIERVEEYDLSETSARTALVDMIQDAIRNELDPDVEVIHMGELEDLEEWFDNEFFKESRTWRE